MRIKDCVVKPVSGHYWLHHVGSGYKAKLDGRALAALQGVLAKKAGDPLGEDESALRERLLSRGLLEEGEGSLRILSASPLEAVEIEFSGRCNLRCGHCYATLCGTDASQELLDRVLEGVDALQPVLLGFGGGEPLLNPLLPQALESARGRGLRIAVSTNGTLVTEELARHFAHCRVAKAVVSLDFFEEDHDRLRGKGRFQAAVAGIRRLTAAGVPVFINTMVSDATVERVSEFYRFCQEDLGVQKVRFCAVTPLGRAAGQESLGLSMDGFRKLYGGSLKGDEEVTPLDTQSASRTFKCGAGVRQCTVASNGEVYACHYFAQLGDSMGNLAEKSLAELMGEYARRSVVADFDYRKMAKCVACACLKDCGGGCRARARLLKGGFYEPDPISCKVHGLDC